MDTADTLEKAQDRAQQAMRKWQEYERDFILPCFRWARESGIDLEKLVSDNPGKNCVELLVRRLQADARAAKSFEEVIDGVREALGQRETHYLVVAQDVEELVKAVELDERADDGGGRATVVLRNLRSR